MLLGAVMAHGYLEGVEVGQVVEEGGEEDHHLQFDQCFLLAAVAGRWQLELLQVADSYSSRLHRVHFPWPG
jgi:hypothetical protein